MSDSAASTEGQSDRASLHYREGSSDKVYQASIDAQGGGFVVNFAYGRRGNTLTAGTKTAKPVDYAAAKKIFDKLVGEKMAKGYTPSESGTPYTLSTQENRVSGLLPQLLNPLDEAEAAAYVADDAWLAQEKFDGKRVLIRKTGDEVVGVNRKGLIIGLPEPIVAAVRKVTAASCTFDGESVGDVYYAFDLLALGGADLAPSPYADRHAALLKLAAATAGALRAAETAAGPAQKAALLDRLRRANKEGIVFKRKDAPYKVGRPASGGSQRKLKFWASASCRVAKGSVSKRSVEVELQDGPKWIGVGKVTIPANQSIPGAGAIVEVKYLYAYPGGSLYQPIYLGARDDIAAADCKVSQLKFKPAGEDEEEGS